MAEQNKTRDEERFLLLTDRYMREDLTDSECDEFIAYPKDQDTNYLDRLQDHLEADQLLRELSNRNPDDMIKATDIIYVGSHVSHYSFTRFQKVLFVVVGLILVALIVLPIAMYSQTNHEKINLNEQEMVKQDETGRFRADAIAMISYMENVEWKDETTACRMGDLVGPGWLRFQSGILALEFLNGTRVVITGPADFMVVSPEQAYCSQGEIYAHVPPQAIGFTIDIPKMKIIDQGTEFSLNVKPEKTEIKVHKGRILVDHALKRMAPIHEGEGLISSADGTLTPVTHVKQEFPETIQNISLASESQNPEPLNAWKKVMAKLSSDPSTLLLYDMETIDSGRVLVNKASSRRWNGTVVGCKNGRGCFSQKQGLAFRRLFDRVRFSVPDPLSSCTILARIQISGLDRRSNGLMMSDGFKPGGVAWSIDRTEGKSGHYSLCFDIYDKYSDKIFHYHSPACIGITDLGRWLTVAVVMDQKKKTITQYLEGKQVSAHVIQHDFPMEIRLAELGNWMNVEDGKDYEVRNFCGTMDHFVLLNRALAIDDLIEYQQSF